MLGKLYDRVVQRLPEKLAGAFAALHAPQAGQERH